MQFKTYRAKTIHEALALVRRDLGPDAAVLGTREVRGTGGMLGWLRGDRLIEVTASAEVIVPSRLPRRVPAVVITPPRFESVSGIDLAASTTSVATEANLHSSSVNTLAPGTEGDARRPAQITTPAPAWLLDSLLDVETPEDLARELVEQAMRSLAASDAGDSKAARTHLVAAIGRELEVAGPILSIARQRRLVALVGPTGVGKTTTTAKLAAHFRLREQRRVGLITVDTYRIAAVDQLRTYAEIIDLPMEVASTPHEMQQAIGRLADLDLILMDTAGRSPRDEAQIEELKLLLDEAQPDEVHLVLSCASAAAAMASSIERFAWVGANRMVLTKLDEAQGLGALLPLLRLNRLPLSYVTHGQNVPDDIEVADPVRLAQQILGSRWVSAA
ncbi:MAG TPA: flagellar biosynthesis protein FlhF [Pirellulales bacterium]|jgi:flagellar biosynthesis protein FlhF|nr:flagellar biosynthesis protein FlhF [Pirellulales bacterium]